MYKKDRPIQLYLKKRDRFFVSIGWISNGHWAFDLRWANIKTRIPGLKKALDDKWMELNYGYGGWEKHIELDLDPKRPFPNISLAIPSQDYLIKGNYPLSTNEVLQEDGTCTLLRGKKKLCDISAQNWKLLTNPALFFRVPDQDRAPVCIYFPAERPFLKEYLIGVVMPLRNK